MSADGAIRDTRISKAGSASLGAIDGIIDTTVTAVHDVNLVSHDAVLANVIAGQGNLSVRALKDIGGTYRGGAGVRLTAFGKLNSITAESAAGPVHLWAHGSLSAGWAVAGTEVSAFALDEIRGTFIAKGGDVLLHSLAAMDQVTVTAARNAFVHASREISGAVHALRGHAVVVSSASDPLFSGAVKAEVVARRDATVSALGGDVTGRVVAMKGTAVVTAAGNVTEAVEAGRNATVWASGDLTHQATVTAGANATVTARGAVHADVDAMAGSASVDAGGHASGNVTADKNATVRAHTGNVSGEVTADRGDALVVAMGSVDGNVTGGSLVNVFALSNIAGKIRSTAGSVQVTSLGENISQEINAAMDARIFAFGDVTGMVVAGHDLNELVMGSQTADVIAGHDLRLEAYGGVTARVTAGRNAEVNAFDKIEGDITATQGDVSVSSWSDLTSTVTSGKYSALWAAGRTSVTVDAGDFVTLVSYGVTAPTVTAGTDAYVWSGESMKGTITAADSISASALGSAEMQINAGVDAGIWSLDRFQGLVAAGRDAWVVALSDFSGSVDAGRDAMVASLGSARGMLDALRHAQVASLDQVEMEIAGAGSAYAWAYSDLVGQVRSSSGFAGAVALGNMDAGITSGTDGFAMAGGRLSLQLNAAGDAYTWAGGDVQAFVQAGGNAAAYSFGWMTLVLSAELDAVAVSVGNLDGMYTAGRDMGLASYGKINVAGAAGQDMAWLWAAGDIEGTYAVGRNVGEVFSYGNIDIALDAQGELEEMGRVNSVQAWGTIGGTISADEAIDRVRAGGEVTAFLAAPQVSALVEFDANIDDECPFPETPDSGMEQARAEAAAARSDIFLAREDLVLRSQAMRNSHAEERLRVARNIADDKQRVAGDRDKTLSDSVRELAEARKRDSAEFQRWRDEAAREDAATRAEAEMALNRASQERTEDIAEGNARFEESKQKTAQAQAEATDAKLKMVSNQSAAYRNMLDKQWGALHWRERSINDEVDKITNQVIAAMQLDKYPEYAWQWLQETTERSRNVYDTMRDQGASRSWATYAAAGVFISDHTPMTKLWIAATGEDPVTLKQYTNSARLFYGAVGTVELAMMVAGGVRVMQQFKGPCGGYVFRRCFAGDTQVVLHEADLGTTDAFPAPGLSTGDSRSIQCGLACLAIGLGALPVLSGRIRKRNSEAADAALEDAIEDIFGRADEPEQLPDPLPADASEPLWGLSSDDFNPLCDRLFADRDGRSSSVSQYDGALVEWDNAVSATSLRREQAENRYHANPKISSPSRRGAAVRKHAAQPDCARRQASTRRTPKRNGHSLSFPILWLVVFGLLGAGWLAGPHDQRLRRPSSSVAWASADSSRKYVTKPIRDIRANDLVLTRDQHGSDLGLKRVTEVYPRISDHLRILEFASPDGSTQTLRTTNKHPFWEENANAFVDAGELRPGSVVTGPKGEPQLLLSTVVEPHPEGVQVYNFQVDDYHTYFVQAGSLSFAPILVHNADGYSEPTGLESELVRQGNKSRVINAGLEVRAVRDLGHIEESTLRAMAQYGFAPKDINGNKIILHHLDQNPAGPIVEMPAPRHSIHNSVQHPLGNAPGVGLTAEQRTTFNAWREDYWKKRALEELAKRGISP